MNILLLLKLKYYLNLQNKFLALTKKKNLKKTFLKKKNFSGCTVKSAIEGVVFINVPLNYSVFIGELILLQILKPKGLIKFKIIKGMVIGLSTGTAEVMLFGDTSEIAPGNH